jgi:protein SCO1/2
MDAGRMRGFMDRNTGWVLVAALAAGLGLWAAQAWFAAPAPKPAVGANGDKGAAPSTKAVRLYTERRAMPAFSLRGARGPVANADLMGHWTLVFLGFTHCPDVCPTTLSQLAQAQSAWQALPESTRPRLLFVSVDPARDPPESLATYAGHFHADTVVATADEPALQEFVKALGLVYMKVDMPGGDYMMEHSSSLVVLDPQGRQAGLVRAPLDPRAIAAELAMLAKDAP